MGDTGLEFPCNSQGISLATEKVVPNVVPFEPILEPSAVANKPECSMLKAVIDAWDQMTEAEKSLCYSMACHALGKPLFGRQD